MYLGVIAFQQIPSGTNKFICARWYLLQGWIKGVNAFDTDLDGNEYNKTTPDAFSYRLDYFTNDYTSIGGSSLSYAPGLKSLYNGNIAGMSTGLWRGEEENSTGALNVHERII